MIAASPLTFATRLNQYGFTVGLQSISSPRSWGGGKYTRNIIPDVPGPYSQPSRDKYSASGGEVTNRINGLTSINSELRPVFAIPGEGVPIRAFVSSQTLPALGDGCRPSFQGRAA